MKSSIAVCHLSSLPHKTSHYHLRRHYPLGHSPTCCWCCYRLLFCTRGKNLHNDTAFLTENIKFAHKTFWAETTLFFISYICNGFYFVECSAKLPSILWTGQYITGIQSQSALNLCKHPCLWISYLSTLLSYLRLAMRLLLRPIPRHFSRCGAKRDAAMLLLQLGHTHSLFFHWLYTWPNTSSPGWSTISWRYNSSQSIFFPHDWEAQVVMK